MESQVKSHFERSRKTYNTEFQCISTALNVTASKILYFLDSLF